MEHRTKLEEVMELALKSTPLHGEEAKILVNEIFRLRKEMEDLEESKEELNALKEREKMKGMWE